MKIFKSSYQNEPDILISVGKYTKLCLISTQILKFHYISYEKVLKLLNIIQNKDTIMIKGSNLTKLHIVAKNYGLA